MLRNYFGTNHCSHLWYDLLRGTNLSFDLSLCLSQNHSLSIFGPMFEALFYFGPPCPCLAAASQSYVLAAKLEGPEGRK